METLRDVLDLERPKLERVRCKGQNGAWPLRNVDTEALIKAAARLWRTKNFDTADIAQRLKVHESEIWIRMDRIRKGG